MNIHRFFLPASIAATAHVALLWAIPREPWVPHPRLVEVSPGCTLPPATLEEAAPPPFPERKETIEPVRPLTDAPKPPELAPREVRPQGEFDPPAREDWRRKFERGAKIIPTTFGGGEEGAPGLGGWQGTGIRPADQLDRVPRATLQPPPDFPERLRRAGIGGSATVEFEVDAGGRVVRAEAIGYTHREFAEPAVRAVLKWRFEPGRHHGRAVPFRMAIPIEFSVATD